MRKKPTKLIMALLILIMFLTMSGPTVQAAKVCSVQIPVTVTLSGSVPTNKENYEIVLKADNPVYPMPEGSVSGVYNTIIKGADAVKLPEIQFSTLGIYTYTITQAAGTNQLCTYDSSKYYLKVYVTNVNDGSCLETTVIACKDNETEKLDQIEFRNIYSKPEEPEPTPTPAPTPTPEVTPEPTPTPTVTPIPTGSEIIEEVEIPGGGVIIDDGDVPGGGVVPKTSDNTIIWPYTVLFSGGAAMLLILGFTAKRKKQ